jgi:large subunit ribosomal protein L20
VFGGCYSFNSSTTQKYPNINRDGAAHTDFGALKEVFAMPRTKNTVAGRERRKKILKQAKGFRGGRGTLYRTARETVERALVYAYRDRKQRKRHFRALWIQRINAAARINGLSYSRLISGLKRAEVDIDRKMLAEMAVNDSDGFKRLADVAKAAWDAGAR